MTAAAATPISDPAGPAMLPTLQGYKRAWARFFLQRLYWGCGVLAGVRLVEVAPNAIDPNAPGKPTGLAYHDAGDILAVLWTAELIERGLYRPSAVDFLNGEKKPGKRRKLEADYMGAAPLSPVGRPHLEDLPGTGGLMGRSNGAGLTAYVWHEVPARRADVHRFITEAT